MPYNSPLYGNDWEGGRMRDIQVLSRYPIENYSEITSIENVQTMLVSIDIAQKIRIFNVHFHYPNTCDKADNLLSIAQNYTDYPKILIGDFNVHRDMACYQRILTNYHDS